MRRLLLCSMLIVFMCFASGCEDSSSGEKAQTAGEQIIEFEQRAEDAVDEMNKDTMRIDETADSIENVIEE